MPLTKEQIQAKIDSYINSNGNNEITGSLMHELLTDMNDNLANLTSGTDNYIPKYSTGAFVNSNFFDDGETMSVGGASTTNINIGTGASITDIVLGNTGVNVKFQNVATASRYAYLDSQKKIVSSSVITENGTNLQLLSGKGFDMATAAADLRIGETNAGYVYLNRTDTFYVRDNGVVSSKNGYWIDGDKILWVDNFVFNTASGYEALMNDGGQENTAFGYMALKNVTTGGLRNTGIGATAGQTITTGDNNVFIGPGADGTASSRSNSIAIGYLAKTTANGQAVIGGFFPGINAVYFGQGVSVDNSLPLSAIQINPTGITAGFTDVSAANGILYINGAVGTGTGNGGDIVLRVAKPGSTGSARNTLTSVITISGVTGYVKYEDGNQGAGKVLMSDANGVANWTTAYIENLTSDAQAQIDNLSAGLGGRLLSPVADIAALKAINTTSSTNYPDKTMINVEDTGLYRLDRDSAAAGDDNRIVEPTAGVGRWIKMAASINDHNLLSNIQGGTTGEYYHLTSAQYTVVGNTSGINTGDQTITLTGDVTGSGTGSFATAIGANKVLITSMLSQISTDTILGRDTAGTGNVEVLTALPNPIQDAITRLGTITQGVWNATQVAVGYGGTGTTTTFTPGSLVFAGASGVYTEDNANLFYDNATNQLGIGINASLGANLHIKGYDNATAGIALRIDNISTLTNILTVRNDGRIGMSATNYNAILNLRGDATTRDAGFHPAIEIAANATQTFPGIYFSNQTASTRYGGITWTRSTSGATNSSVQGSVEVDETGNISRMHLFTNANIGTTGRSRSMLVYGDVGVTVGNLTTTPDVYGITSAAKYLTVYTANSTDAAILNLIGSSTGSSLINLGNGTIRRAAIQGIDGSHILFYTNSTNSGASISEKMRIISAGDVGIGATTPDIYSFGATWRMLTVQNTTATNSAAIKVIAGTSGSAAINFGNATIRRSAISAVDGSDFGIYTNNTNSGTSVTLRVLISSLGNVVLGSQAALATNATDGFTYIPICAGAPSGVPTAYTGKVAIIYDTTNNKLYVYNGAWKSITLS